MFKYWSLKKYDSKLLPQLIKQYGRQEFYSPSQVRTIVYKKDFDPQFLPLGYILFVRPDLVSETIEKEFPQLQIAEYKKEIGQYLTRKSYKGYLQSILASAA